MEDLSTWEGLYETATKYYRFTDAQTPDTAGDGKCFLAHDYPFNYMMVGMQALGGSFFEQEKLSFGDSFDQVWMPFAKSAITGGIWLQDGYATEALRTGNAIVSVASSASVLYYEDVVTYADNTSEEIEVVASPIPVFENGEKLVMQRGAGFCITKSDKEREAAAVTFLKWLTAAQNNVRFVTDAGYMPVKDEGFSALPQEIEKLPEGKYKRLYEAFLETQDNYEFFTPPQFSSYLDLETNVEQTSRNLLREARSTFLEQSAAWTELSTKEREQKENELAEQLARECEKKLIAAMQ